VVFNDGSYENNSSSAFIGDSRFLSQCRAVMDWGGPSEAQMGAMTYCVAHAFERSEDTSDIVACDPREARSSEQAIRLSASLAKEEGHCGAIAFSRTGDPALGDFEDAVILKTVREVDIGLLTV
jgi:hypothetical protein